MSFVNDILSGVEKLLLGGVAGRISDNQGGKAPEGDIVPGDIEIVGITLLSEDEQRQYSLLAQCTTLDIYEDIISPAIFAELTIADSIGLLQSFPILGEEYVLIEFKTPGTDGPPASYLLRVNQVKDKTVAENNKMITYTLQCVSAEVLRNSSRHVTKTYERNIDDVIREIITEDLSTEKPLNIDRTSGIEQGTITKMEPFKAIDFLRRRAVSNEFTSSSFVFFENRNGYHFTTIEKLMDDGRKLIDSGGTDKEFFFDMARKDNVASVTIRNILAYNQLTFTDTIAKVQAGGITNSIEAYDLITGGVKKVTYTNNIGQDQFKFADSNSASMNSTGFNRKHGKTTSINKFITVRSDKPSTQMPEMITQSQAYAMHISQNIVQIHIYGDSEIQVGDMIKCNFPSATSMDDDSGLTRLDSGNYLVTKVRHIILNTDRPQHTIALELIKGNLTEVS